MTYSSFIYFAASFSAAPSVRYNATNFARVVHQPARPGRPFLRPAALEALEQVPELLDVIVDAWNGAA